MKEYRLDFKKRQGEERRKPIFLSEAGANEISAQLKNRDRHIERLDDGGRLMEMIDKYDVQGVVLVGDKKPQAEKSAVCGYGTRHPHRGKEGFESCNCFEKYKVTEWKFFKLVQELYPEVEYAIDITLEMQEKALEKIAKALNPPRR